MEGRQEVGRSPIHNAFTHLRGYELMGGGGAAKEEQLHSCVIEISLSINNSEWVTICSQQNLLHLTTFFCFVSITAFNIYYHHIILYNGSS